MFTEWAYFFISIRDIYLKFLGTPGYQLLSTCIMLFFVLFMLLEIIVVHSSKSRRLMERSYLTNLAVFGFNSVLLSLLSTTSLLMLAEKYQYHGLLTDYSQPFKILITFVLFDLILYLWHKSNHDFDLLWCFHKVHHSDQSMNVTTAFRVHFIEVLMTTVIKAVFILLTGIEAFIVALCETVLTLFVMFHHLNLSFRSEKWFKWLFIVPSLHRVHHSSLRAEHDSNYGAVFSIWDRIFSTYRQPQPVKVGLKNVKGMNFYELMKFGLSVPTAVACFSSENIYKAIQEAAYYKAEKRGFVPGSEMLDWLEAERELKMVDRFVKTEKSKKQRCIFLDRKISFFHANIQPA